MTGLRQGELIALRWEDVDWEAGRVRVRRSYVRGEFSAPKSRRGVRSVPLADRLAGELERHFQASRFQADHDLVFAQSSPRGAARQDHAARKRFKAALQRAGVREVRFHDLRHTFGTRMAGVGVPIRTLQEWMGHRDFKTTLIYADYAPSGSTSAEWVEAAFEGLTSRPFRLIVVPSCSRHRKGRQGWRRVCLIALRAAFASAGAHSRSPASHELRQSKLLKSLIFDHICAIVGTPTPTYPAHADIQPF